MFHQHQIRYSLLALLAASMLALSACGGSSKTATMPEPPPTPTPDPAIAQRAEINMKITAASTAVTGLTDDASDAAIGSAESAVTAAKEAVMGASAVPDTEKAAFNRAIEAVEDQLTTKKTSIMAARGEAAAAMKAAMAKTGKALHAALGPPATGDILNALGNIGAPTLAATGLTIDATIGAGALPDTEDPASVELKAGDSVGSLGGWMGMDYALTTGTGSSKLTNEARVYTNRSAPTSKAFGDVHTVITDDGANKGYLAVDGSAAAEVARVMAAAFTHSGTQTHTKAARADAVYLRGTYDGAPGEYRCTGDVACTSTNNGSGSPSALGGTWHFKPDAGATVSQPDANYLYYGWWVSKDKDGGPTAASAFAGIVGDVDGDQAAVNGADLSGSATYAGKAAGKFAMSNPLDGTGNGGHFTADAMLSAKFGGGADAGMTGTIDNFRLNDGSEDPGWSVSLARGAWAADGAITAPASNPTVWSINGNKADASGTWSGTMHDEMPGNAPAGDGSNIPTTVTGTFYSEFSTIGRMVGGFGANKQ